MKTKIIAGILTGFLIVSSTFAYDLTDKEKTKGDTIVSKIMMIITKRPEEKREKLTKSVVTQLEGLQERARKNEKMAALIGYVVEKMKSGTGGVNSRYPGCNKDDIALDNGQIWSACDVGSIVAWEAGEQFAWGSMTGYKDLSVSEKVWPGNNCNETDPQGPCRTGYHVPGKVEVEKAIINSGSAQDFFKKITMTQEFWVSASWGNYGGKAGGEFFNWTILNYNYKSEYKWIRCTKN